MINTFYSSDDFFDYNFIDNSLKETKLATDKKKYSCEMTRFELAFLFGLLNLYKPQKIVEVGLAAGGTTKLMLDYLQQQNIDSKLFSVDKNIHFYRDKLKRTCYLAIEKYSDCANWKLLVGGILPTFLSEIGSDIDFLILDTVHSLPGELLDFISIIPFLKEGAIVGLHDINLCHLGSKHVYLRKLF